MLAALERNTGRTVDRSPTTGSFLGLPVHVASGETVYVTDDTVTVEGGGVQVTIAFGGR